MNKIDLQLFKNKKSVNNEIKGSISSRVATWILRCFLLIWSFIIVFPLFWMIYTSVKQREEFIADRFALPKDIWLPNYQTAWTNSSADSSLLHYFGNTFIIVLISTILLLIMVAGTSYVLAKYSFKGRKIFENFYFVAMMIPSVLVLVPLWFQLRNLGNTVLGSNSAISDNIFTVSIIYAVQSVPVYVFLLVGFIRKIDDGFLEAAVIDGAGEWTIFFKVIVPFIRPTLMFIALGNIMNVWNEYTLARTFLESEKNYTISVGIQSIQNAFTYSFNYGALFATLVLSMIPILILYIIFQKQIQSGTDMGEGIKG